MPLMRRTCSLIAQILCLASPGIVAVAFWDLYFDPLAIKELLVESLGLLAFLFWWVGKDECPPDGRRERYPSLANPLGWPLFGLVAWSFVSLLWTGPKGQALHHWASMAGLLLFIPPLFDFGRCPRFRSKFRAAILVLGGLLLFLSALQVNGVSLGGLMRTGGGNTRTRVSITIGHNNGVAPIILMFSFLALAWMAETRERAVRGMLFLYTIACWSVILFSLLTRSTILGLLICGFLLILLNLFHYWKSQRTADRNRGSRRLLWGLGIGLAAIVALLAASGYFAVRGGQIEGRYNPNMARNIVDRLRTLNPQFLMVDSRARLWAIGICMIRQHPLLGLGFSSSKHDYPLYQALFFERHPDFPSGPTPLHSERLHNDYIQWAAECGAIGAVLLLWLLTAFGKTLLLALRRVNQIPWPRWFALTATFLAVLVPALDGCFSFPGHIAPIAVFMPGLFMLWSGFLPPSGKRGPGNGLRSTSLLRGLLPAKAALALLVWSGVFFAPGRTSDEPALVTRLTGWVPIQTQIEGRYWHGRIASANEEFRTLLSQFAAKLRAGQVSGAAEIENTLRAVKRVRELFLKYPQIIPFAGEGVFAAANAMNHLNQFYGTIREDLFRQIQKGARSSALGKFVNEEYQVALGLLPEADRLYRLAEQNYRHHNLYRGWAQVQLDLAGRSGGSAADRQRLVESGRKHLELARRIYYQSVDLLVEIDVSLRVHDSVKAAELLRVMLARDPGYLVQEALPRIAREAVYPDTKTGRKRLDPYATELLTTLLPLLGEDHLEIFRIALYLLSNGNQEELLEEYAAAALPLAPFHERKFLEYQMLKRRSALKDLPAVIEEYRQAPDGKSVMAPENRLYFLSDAQRMAPIENDWSGWEDEVRELASEYPDLSLVRVVGQNALGCLDWNRGDLLGMWRHRIAAQAETNVRNFDWVTDRRPVAMDPYLWGIGWPLMLE